MATNSMEIPGKTVKFDSITHLRDELGKQSKNPERLDELQKTIDEAVKEGEKQGIIEFTEDEWKSLITNDQLPPIEAQKKLLKEKINQRTQITEVAKKQNESFLEEMKGKAEEAKKSLGEKADGLKNAATGKMQEWKDKAEKLKQYSKPGLWFLGIGLSLKLWGYKLGNWFSGLFGKKGEYDDEIKKIEMEKEFMRDPKAALEKYGAEAKEKLESGKGGAVEEKKEEATEKKEGLIEKAGPLAILGGAGVGIFSLIKKKLPKSVVENLDGKDGKTLLAGVARNRVLRGLGIGGVTLFGLSKLAQAVEDPKIAAELGEMPSEPEAQRKWWEKLMTRAGVMSQDILDLVMGKKLDEKLKTKEVPDGYLRIEDHPMTAMAMQEIRKAWGEMQELVRSGGADALKLLGGAVALKSPTLMLSAGIKTPLLLMTLMLKPLGVPFAMLAGLFIAIMQGETYLKNICIPDTIQTPEDLSEYLQDILQIDEISEYVREFLPEGATDDVTAMCDLLSHPDQIQAKIRELRKNMKEKIAVGIKGGLEMMTTSEKELIQKVNTTGIKNLIGYLTTQVSPENIKKYAPLVVILQKYEKTAITPESYREIITACQQFGIRIIPSEDHGEKLMEFSVWEGEECVGSGPLVLNPKYSQDEQYETARRTAFNKGFLGYATLQWNEMQDEFNDILRAFEHDPQKAHNIIEAILYRGGILGGGVYVAGEMTLEYMGKVITIPQKFAGGLFDYMTGKDGSLEIQEGIVAYAGGLFPAFVIGKTGNLFRSKYERKGFGRLVFDSAIYPLRNAKKMYTGGKFIWNRRNNLSSILTDPVMMLRHNINAGVLRNIGEITGVKSIQKAAIIHELKSALIEAKKLSDSGKTESEINAIFDTIKKRLKNNEHGSGDLVRQAGISIDDLNASKLNTGLPERLIAHLDGDLDSLIRTQGPEIRKVLSQSLEKRLGKSGIRVDSIFDETITDPKQKMEDGKTKIERKLSDIDVEFERNLSAKEVLKADLDAGRIDISRYNDEMENILKDIRKLGEERKLLSKLHKAIRIHLHFPEKFKLRAKHAGIAALGAAAVYAMLNSAYKEGEVPEDLDAMIRDVESEPGFTPSSDEEKKSHDIETSFHKEEVNHELRKIQSSYTALDTLITEDLADSAKKSSIEGLTEQHQKNLDSIWSMLADPNKRPILEGIMQENKNEEIVLNSFCSLKTENGEAVVSFLNKDGFKKQIWEDVEGGEFLEGLAKGPNSNAAKIAIETGTYMIPFVGTGRDGYDAYEGFSRGNIKDGFIATGWAAIGLISDVALFTGVGTAAGVAGKAACAAAKGARIVDAAKDAKNAWKMARSDYKLAIEAAKAGKNLDHLTTMQKAAVMMHKYGTTKAYLTLGGAQEIQGWMTKLRNTTTKLKDIPLKTKNSIPLNTRPA